jgi:hypothetical protein
MPNMQIPLAGLGPREAVACAIHCCDKAPYSMPKKSPPKPEISCQRLAHRKHSCVTHNLRERTPSGKLKKKSRKSNILVAPRSHAKIGGKIRVPDTIVKEGGKWNIIDAKFPCDSKKLNAKMPLKNASSTSTSAGGKSMMTSKEKTDYKKFKVGGKSGTKVSKVECMTPKDAKAKKGKCSCTKKKSN